MSWSKYQSNPKRYAQNQYLNHLVEPSFQRVNRLFVLSLQNEKNRTAHTGYYFPKIEIKYYNAKINGKIFFDQPINNDTKTYENIFKIATGQGDDYTTGYLIDYRYFKKFIK